MAVEGHGEPDVLLQTPQVDGALSDAVTVADQTAGPHGVPMSISARMDDMLARHGGRLPRRTRPP
jgi:hypothetical protein